MTSPTRGGFKLVFGLAAVLALGACANTNGPAYTSSPGVGYPPAPASNTRYGQYGVVQSIELVRPQNGGDNAIGVGTVVGAVVGGLLGNQVGAGNGKTAATVVGAAGGAYVGHQIEKGQQQTSDAYRVTVRMSDGSYQAVTQSSSADIGVGDRVLVDNGVARRY